jgi:VCBS repeat protein
VRRLVSSAVVVAVLLLVPAASGVTAPYDPFFAPAATIADVASISPVSSASNRVFGIAAGDYDEDGRPDVIAGRTDGRVHFVKGNGDGTFAVPSQYAWKQTTFNAWAFGSGDLNDDGNLDLVWGANALTSGCTVSPIPAGQTCASIGGTTVTVNDGDVRVFYGNGNGSFAENTYFVSGVRHNAGALLADIGTDAGSVAVGDVDGDSDEDVVAGAIDGTNSVVKLLVNNGGGSFAASTLVSETTSCTTSGAGTTCSQVYFPAISTQNSPWGLALADADGDSDLDLLVGDRALYVYLYRNSGTGAFTLQAGNSAVSNRPNVYLGHDAFRAAVGFTPSLTAADFNGDGKADVALGLQAGAQTPASGTFKDGAVLLDVSSGSGHTGFGELADIGEVARGVTAVDVNSDGNVDLVAGVFDGSAKLLRQLPPLDDDADGISDYVDNALGFANAPRLEMNSDGSVNYRDQLDNDFDSALGDPEDQSTWSRLGDPADPDDDNDGVLDGPDNCAFSANPAQANADADLFGDACDPLDDRDADSDGVPTGPLPDEVGYAAANAAAVKWSTGSTKFVLRIDALSRIFQNEFTQLMTDAATLAPDDWAVKCWENYGPGGGDPPDPCGTGEGTAEQTLTLPGGKEVPIALVVIPRQLWTDGPVIAWINDRFQSERLEVGQHGTDHPNNVPVSDWKDDPARNWLSCETCGLSEAEVFQLLRLGRNMLTGDYAADKWVGERGATASSAKVDWSLAAHQLLSYAAPFNASDETARKAMAQLGLKAFSASRFEEDGSTSYGSIFTPGGVNKHEQFDEWGMFHVSADRQVDPPDDLIGDGDYSDGDRAEYEAFLGSITQPGGLNTWLIEEVEWSGRACNDKERLVDCDGTPNREDNTVYAPRWAAWLHLLDFVKAYPDSVVLTMGEVALAKGYDNAPTVANTGQADTDHDGLGDAIDGASLAFPAETKLSRNAAGVLSATLTNGAGDPIAGQQVTFSFDADGDGTEEAYDATTASDGAANAAVTPTRVVGAASYSASWDGLRAAAAGNADVTVTDTTSLTLDSANPSSGQVTDSVTVAATLADSDGAPLEGRTVGFSIGSASATAMTDASGRASATLVLPGPAGAETLTASFAGADFHGSSSDSSLFTIAKEDTILALSDAVAMRDAPAVARATLTEADGAALAGRAVEFFVNDRVYGWVSLGTATTDAAGIASRGIPNQYSAQGRAIRANFAGDASFLPSSGSAFAFRS